MTPWRGDCSSAVLLPVDALPDRAVEIARRGLRLDRNAGDAAEVVDILLKSDQGRRTAGRIQALCSTRSMTSAVRSVPGSSPYSSQVNPLLLSAPHPVRLASADTMAKDAKTRFIFPRNGLHPPHNSARTRTSRATSPSTRSTRVLARVVQRWTGMYLTAECPLIDLFVRSPPPLA